MRIRPVSPWEKASSARLERSEQRLAVAAAEGQGRLDPDDRVAVQGRGDPHALDVEHVAGEDRGEEALLGGHAEEAIGPEVAIHAEPDARACTPPPDLGDQVRVPRRQRLEPALRNRAVPGDLRSATVPRCG